MRVVGYVRVSTDKQAEQGLGIEVQERAVMKWARACSHELVAIHRDEGVSGGNGLETRIGLADALEAISEGRGGGVVVYRLDRLARELVLQEHLLAEIRRMGGELFSTDGGEQAYLKDDPEEPSRKLIRQVLGAVSEYERAMIALRLKAGRRRKAERGGFAYGSPPYGWRAEGGELVPDPFEQEAVRTAYRLRTEGATLAGIAATLEDAGFSPRRGGRWHPVTVQRVLRRGASTVSATNSPR